MRRTPLTRTCARAPALQCEKLTRRGRLLEALTTLTGSFRQPTSDPRMRVAKTIHVTSAQLTKTALLPCSLSCAARKTCAFVKIRMSRGARSCRITVEILNSCRVVRWPTWKEKRWRLHSSACWLARCRAQEARRRACTDRQHGGRSAPGALPRALPPFVAQRLHGIRYKDINTFNLKPNQFKFKRVMHWDRSGTQKGEIVEQERFFGFRG